ncbi:MAG: ferredoxin [Roseobacter sp.]
MDRWSTRVIGDWATEIGATALYPFGGAPFLPFFSWATRTGRIHASPIMLLVHDTAGLFVSFRGALALPWHVTLPAPPPNPCDSCTDQPCRTACPVGAFDGSSYDVAGCKSFLGTDAGQDCVGQGCQARSICPVSAAYPRETAQSAYHMHIFKG